MPTPAELAALDAAIIADATEGISRATNDQGSVEMQSVSERLKARGAVAADSAANKPGRGLRFTKLNSPGTV